MNMHEKEINRYLALNKLAAASGTVLFGGTEDKEIPVHELQQSFSFEENIYNRSFTNLSVHEAVEVFAACVEELCPGHVLLHIGSADTEHFKTDPAGFDKAYRKLITHIRNTDKTCIISVISLKNPGESPVISELNRLLELIAASEQCYFHDINAKQVWNPKEIREIISFVTSTGFVRPLKRTTPNYDLIKVLFCYDDNVSSRQTEHQEDEKQDMIRIQSEEAIAGTL